MSRPSISLTAPSRLHFGLFSVGRQVERQFGGIGLMIQNPQTQVIISEAKDFSIVGGPHQEILQNVELWIREFGSFGTPAISELNDLGCRLELVEQPPQHWGLGSGTQLAMSCATALFKFFDLPIPRPEELAAALGRAGRSAIGTHGFVRGGLLVDRGNTPDEPVAPLDFQIDFPEQWPIVIATLKTEKGLYGTAESFAFDQLPDVSRQTQHLMIEKVNSIIVPAVVSKDYETFANAIYEFGRQSGLFFQTVQGGPYNGPQVTGLVESIRKFGVAATGQSSWGPSVYAICSDIQSAECLIEHLEMTFGPDCKTMITRADNTGARTEIEIPNPTT